MLALSYDPDVAPSVQRRCNETARFSGWSVVCSRDAAGTRTTGGSGASDRYFVARRLRASRSNLHHDQCLPARTAGTWVQGGTEPHGRARICQREFRSAGGVGFRIGQTQARDGCCAEYDGGTPAQAGDQHNPHRRRRYGRPGCRRAGGEPCATGRECDRDNLSWPGACRQASTDAARGRPWSHPCGSPLASRCIQRTYNGRHTERGRTCGPHLGTAASARARRQPRRFAGAFAAIVQERTEALIVMPSPMLFGEYKRIAGIATDSRLPAMGAAREFAEFGGLMSYGANLPDLARQTATHADKILKGAKPAELPVEQPVKFELVINLKTARELGLTIGRAFLLVADDVIE
ncbi:MAG TPA: ABC transporter substrate-binding protein [Bradyrhizobium sp.]|nr:ABC transporter substrate-binding protein [Bradyrhizobium sp.]HXB78314.1 ABC transporter substrate-binding protein [Bradyrhizobium sp.]